MQYFSLFSSKADVKFEEDPFYKHVGTNIQAVITEMNKQWTYYPEKTQVMLHILATVLKDVQQIVKDNASNKFNSKSLIQPIFDKYQKIYLRDLNFFAEEQIKALFDIYCSTKYADAIATRPGAMLDKEILPAELSNLSDFSKSTIKHN